MARRSVTSETGSLGSGIAGRAAAFLAVNHVGAHKDKPPQRRLEVGEVALGLHTSPAKNLAFLRSSCRSEPR